MLREVAVCGAEGSARRAHACCSPCGVRGARAGRGRWARGYRLRIPYFENKQKQILSQGIQLNSAVTIIIILAQILFLKTGGLNMSKTTFWLFPILDLGQKMKSEKSPGNQESPSQAEVRLQSRAFPMLWQGFLSVFPPATTSAGPSLRSPLALAVWPLASPFTLWCVHTWELRSLLALRPHESLDGSEVLSDSVPLHVLCQPPNFWFRQHLVAK